MPVETAVKDYAAANFPENIKFVADGGATAEAAIARLVVSSQIISILGSVVIVLLIVALSYRSLAMGLVPALLTVVKPKVIYGESAPKV